VTATLSPDACYRALTARDVRFDGVFYVGVSTTGVYCRPVCSARTPKRDRCAFFHRPAEAERAGYRACLVCRPELAPGRAPIDAIPGLVARAVGRIEEGYLTGRSVDDLAGALGVTSRHLRRAMEAEVGVSPVALAQSQRLAMAKRLLQDSTLSMTDVAFASGFRSLRRFNALVRERFGRAPSAWRRLTPAAAPRAWSAAAPIVLRLDYRPPFDWSGVLAFLGARAVPGVEQVLEDVYWRTVSVDGRTGSIAVTQDATRHALLVHVPLTLVGSLMTIAARLRRLFDLDAAPHLVTDAFARDPHLRGLVRLAPGLRVPGAFDPYEMTVRAILGQQVTVRAATTIAGRLVRRFGQPLPAGEDYAQAIDALTHVFPPADVIAAATEGDVATLGMPGARARSLIALSRAVAAGDLPLERGIDVLDTIRRIDDLPGFGPWTAQYIAMRALRWPDAFLAGDLGVRKALGGVTERQAEELSEAWRPWRAYAVLHLWNSLS